MNDALLSFRSTIRCASGSATRNQVTAAEAGTGGKSALQRTRRPWHSMMRAFIGRDSAGTSLVMTPLELRANSNCCHRRAGTLYMVPGGLCRSEYSGAVKARRCVLRLVAHMRRPRQLSRSLRCTCLDSRKPCSCCLSLSNLVVWSSTVSARKLNFQPHQTRPSPRQAFFQEMGTWRMVRQATIKANWFQDDRPVQVGQQVIYV